MTLGVRNTIFRTSAVIALAALFLFVFLVYQILVNHSPIPANEWPNSWLAWSWQVPLPDLVSSLAATGLIGFFCASVLVVSARIFRRVSSGEVYFFSLFVLSLALEQMRLLQFYLLQINVPPLYGVLITRVIILARIGGALALFAASLYALGVEYPRTGTMTLVLGALGLAFVYLIPVDTVTIDATMVRSVAGKSALELTILAIGLMTITNYIIAGARGHRDRGFLIALSAVLIVAGTQVICFVPELPWLIAASASVAFGLLSFVLVTRAHFLWY